MDEDEYEEYDVEPVPGAFCDRYEVHEGHVYVALNSNVYKCPGFDAEDAAALEREANQPPCPHGLSQSLCAGPGHYPTD